MLLEHIAVQFIYFSVACKEVESSVVVLEVGGIPAPGLKCLFYRQYIDEQAVPLVTGLSMSFLCTA